MIDLDQMSIGNQGNSEDVEQQKNNTLTSQNGNHNGQNNKMIDRVVKNIFIKPIQIYQSNEKIKQQSQICSSNSEQSSSSLISSLSSESIMSLPKEKQQHDKYKSKILDFVFDSHPSKKDISIRYQINGKQKSSSTKILNQQLSNIINQKQEKQEDKKEQDAQGPSLEDFQQDLKKDLEIGLNRYYQKNCFNFCFRCKQVGHVENQCIQKQMIHCNYCLSQKHQGDCCTNVSCFRCNRYGHRKYDCKIQMRLNFCPHCGKTSHKADDCGMIVPVQTKGNNQIVCLTCRQYGHANCNL